MPDRIVFRDPSTGRFISREAAEELDEVTQLTIGPSGVVEAPFSFVEPEDETEADPYDLSDSQWGGRIKDEDDDLDLDRLAATPMPPGMDGFRVTLSGFSEYRGEKNERGLKNTDWFGAGDWPPDESWLEDYGAEGIAHIVFRRGK